MTPSDLVRLAVLVVTLASISPRDASAKPMSAEAQQTVLLVERLSSDLRGRRLHEDERAALREKLASGADHTTIYASYVDRWLLRAAFSEQVRRYFPEGSFASFFLHLAYYTSPTNEIVYYLPHTLTAAQRAAGKDAPPCAVEDQLSVRPWWSKTPVRICTASYLPWRSFDDIGYCAGQPEPTILTPPRKGCGCGPLLLACLPPQEAVPKLLETINQALFDEVNLTAVDIIANDRPLDELLTTTRTWQAGWTEFFYLRRELIGMLAAHPYSNALQRELEAKLDSIDVSAPARWVERKGIYAGSGLFLTPPVMSTVFPTYRVVIKDMMHIFLCTDFRSVHVDSEALLKAVGGQHANLRALAVSSSPMRTTPGCQGCHAPMDNGAGFLEGLRTPLFGSFPTGQVAKGSLYVNGAEDLRGGGTGYASLNALISKQPEFPRCAARRAFQSLVGRPSLNTEHHVIDEWAAEFEHGGRHFAALLRRVLLSPYYTQRPAQ